MKRRQSFASRLLLAYALLALYASLYPFAPWRWPPGLEWPWLPPWPKRLLRFDVVINIVGYMPLGFLWLTQPRCDPGWGGRGPGGWACCPGHRLPGRWRACSSSCRAAPSLADLWLNSLGALLGVLLAAALNGLAPLSRWQGVARALVRATQLAGAGLLALCRWRCSYPTPLPFGLGQWLKLRELLVDALDGTPLGPAVG